MRDTANDNFTPPPSRIELVALGCIIAITLVYALAAFYLL
jgi:hypothetical protein